MNLSILAISNNEIIATNSNDSLALVSAEFFKSGFNIVDKIIMNVDSEKIEKRLAEMTCESDIVVVLGDEQIEYSFVTKKAIAKFYGVELMTNNFAKNNISAYYKAINVPEPKEVSSYALLPSNSRCITNEFGPMQGFLIENGNKTLFYMPIEASQLRQMFISSVLPYTLSKANKLNKTYVFKTFGLKRSEIVGLIKDLKKNKQKVTLICNEKLLDGEIIINYPSNIDDVVVDGFVSTIYKRLNNYIYAETDTTLEERLRDLLSLNNLTLATAEDFTAGSIASNFLTNTNDGSKFLIESYITPNDSSKERLLGVDKEVLKQEANKPDDVAYQMAIGALESSGADFVIATFGVGNTCYYAIGNAQGIHLYNETFSGNAFEITKKGTSAGFYHLIKKIKKNDFHFGQSTV